MSKFGWDLPPGCTQRMIDEAAGAYDVCQVCGKYADDCICPECPECGEVGKPFCYDPEHGHGITHTEAQLASRAEREATDEADRKADEAMAMQLCEEAEARKRS